MIIPGLVSITFRKLSPAEIVKHCAANHLQCIEWGGDMHVPHGRTEVAREVARITTDHGLTTASYGSYYRVGEPPSEKNPAFEAVLETASALQAPVIRVWPGIRGSAEADSAYRAQVVADLQRICSLAAKAGIVVACERHGGSLTDTNESAAALYREVQSDNCKAYWQPPVGMSPDACLAGLEDLLPHLIHLHVFHWVLQEGQCTRKPLADGADLWTARLARAASTQRPHAALLEYVADDNPDNLPADAKALHHIIRQA